MVCPGFNSQELESRPTGRARQAGNHLQADVAARLYRPPGKSIRCGPMTLVYRAVWQDSRSGIHDVALKYFTPWVVRKGFPSTVALNDSTRVDHMEVLHRSVDDGTSRADQLSLAEERPNSRGDFWKTTLTTISEPETNWVWIDLEWVAEDVYARQPSWTPPRLVASMLEAGTARAGITTLTAGSVQVQSGEVEALISEVLDPMRAVPIVVLTLGSSDRLSDLQRRSDRAARRVAGLARVVHLAGPAIARFNDGLGEDLRVLPGGIRTYFPGAGDDDDVVARHRYEPAARISRSEDAAAEALVGLLFPRSASQRPPAVYRESLRQLFSSRTSADIDAVFDDMAKEIDDLQDRLTRALEEVAVSRSEQEAAIKQLDDAERRIAWLEQRSAERGDFVRGEPTPESNAEDEATSMCDVAELVRNKLNYVVLCPGADSDLSRLDSNANAPTWARKSLQAFRALEEYAHRKMNGEIDADFRMANEASLLGSVGIQKDWIAMSESETTNNNPNFRQPRTFTIRNCLGRVESVYMPAHIKIAAGGQPSPRIHFHIEESAEVVRVHVGWFGDHLRNTRTS